MAASHSVIGLDVRRDDERAMPGPRMGRGGGMGEVWVGEPVPGQREVEGRGGAFWYEVPHYSAIRWRYASPLAFSAGSPACV